jgi:hypothetical protein
MDDQDDHISPGSEEESNLKSPDRRHMLGATAVAAALGTIGPAGSTVVAQPLAANQVDIHVLKGVVKSVIQTLAAMDVDGKSGKLDLSQYNQGSFLRIANNDHNQCACGCS